MLEIKNFSKSYDGKKKVVENLSLSIAKGDIYGFIGANGAGKTSTMKVCKGCGKKVGIICMILISMFS